MSILCETDCIESQNRSMVDRRSVADRDRSGPDRSDLLNTTNSPCEKDQTTPSLVDRRSVADRSDGSSAGLPVAMAGVSASASERASVDKRSETLRDLSLIHI